MWRRVGRTDGRTDKRTDASLHISAVFFSLYKLPETVTVTVLPLFGHVTLLCGTFLFIYLSEGVVIRLSDQHAAALPYPFTLVCFANTAPLILPPESDQYWSEISPLHATASETFTQRRRQRSGEGSLHSTAVWIVLLLLLLLLLQLQWADTHSGAGRCNLKKLN